MPISRRADGDPFARFALGSGRAPCLAARRMLPHARHRARIRPEPVGAGKRHATPPPTCDPAPAASAGMSRDRAARPSPRASSCAASAPRPIRTGARTPTTEPRSRPSRRSGDGEIRFRPVATRRPSRAASSTPRRRRPLDGRRRAHGLARRATLDRVVDTRGWISADLHVHAVPSPDAPTLLDDRVRSLAAVGRRGRRRRPITTR